MNRRIFLSGLSVFLVCLIILEFPFSPHVSSIPETYSDCQNGMSDLRASILMARGVCEPSTILYYGLSFGVLVGLITTMIGLFKSKTLRS